MREKGKERIENNNIREGVEEGRYREKIKYICFNEMHLNMKEKPHPSPQNLHIHTPEVIRWNQIQ